MKKVLIMMLAAAMLLTAVACGNSNSSSSSTSSSSSQSSESSSSESVPPAPSEGEEKTVSGVITDATMNTVTIKTEDGTELSFSLTDDTDKTKAEGMLVGSSITVTYTGEVNGADTSAAVVTALEITAAPEESGSSQSGGESSESSESGSSGSESGSSAA